MGSTLKNSFVVIAIAGIAVVSGCKSDGSYREHEKTQGEEVEAMEERGDVAIDAADDADE